MLSGAGQRRILIQVSESAFLLDEIDHGREIINAQRQLAAEHHRIRTCNVMIGYASFEVRDALERVVDRVFAYDEAVFPGQFQEFVSRSLNDMSAEIPAVPVPEIAQASRILDSEEAKRGMVVQRISSALDSASAPQRQRQEDALAKQANDQMADILQDIRDRLNNENEQLIRLADATELGRVSMILKIVPYLAEEQESLRRARNLSSRETGTSAVNRIFNALRRELELADKYWQTAAKDNGTLQNSQVDQIRTSIERRQRMLEDGEQCWLNRHRRWWFFTDPLLVAPLAIAVLIVVWLGANYEQSLTARRQALTALRESLNNLIGFAIGYPTTWTDEKSFTSLVVPFEQALLNPVVPIGSSSLQDLRDKYIGGVPPITRLRTTISRVRSGYGVRKEFPPESRPARPTQEAIDDLRAAAIDALKSTYASDRNFTLQFAADHLDALIATGLLLLWCINRPFSRLLLRQLRR